MSRARTPLKRVAHQRPAEALALCATVDRKASQQDGRDRVAAGSSQDARRGLRRLNGSRGQGVIAGDDGRARFAGDVYAARAGALRHQCDVAEPGRERRRSAVKAARFMLRQKRDGRRENGHSV